MKNTMESGTVPPEPRPEPKDLGESLADVAIEELNKVPQPKFKEKTYELGKDRISVVGINNTVSYTINVELSGREDIIEIVLTEPELDGLFKGKYVIDKVARVGNLIELKKGVLVRTSAETGSLLCMVESNDLEKGLLLEEVATKDKIRMKTKDTEVVFNKDGEVATEVDILKENL